MVHHVMVGIMLMLVLFVDVVDGGGGDGATTIATADEAVSLSMLQQRHVEIVTELKDVLSQQQEKRSDMDARLMEMEKETKEVEMWMELQKDLESRTIAMHQMVRDYNAKQLLHPTLTESLEQDVIEWITKRKFEKAPLIADDEKEEDGNDTNDNTDDDDDINDTFITLNELEESLTWQTVDGTSSEDQLERYTRHILEQRFEKLALSTLKQLDESNTNNSKEEEAKNIDDLNTLLELSPSSKCVNHQDATNQVYAKLVDKEKLEHSMKHDNVLIDATIVHSMTSSSYSKTTWEWLAPYIPQDWERWFLNTNWEQSTMPTYLPSFITKNSHNPPQTLLSLNTNVGSCWSIPGNHGQITFRLNTPLTSIHKLIVSHTSQTDNLQTAPKSISLIGYPPCSSTTSQQQHHCKRLGFDTTQPIQLHNVQFQVPQEYEDKEEKEEQDSALFHSTQVFHILTQKEDTTQPEPQQHSCTVDPDTFEPVSSCSGDDDDYDDESSTKNEHQISEDNVLIKALSIVVKDNWGHPDYTCIYSLVVQGQSS